VEKEGRGLWSSTPRGGENGGERGGPGHDRGGQRGVSDPGTGG
jgi:hypothetical protein